MTTTTIILGVLVVLMALALLFFTAAGFLYLTRGNPVTGVRVVGGEKSAPDVSRPLFYKQIERHVSTVLTDGNRIEILFNGDQVYPRLWEDLRNARDVITWHVFWFKPSQLADQLRDILIERLRDGVQVFLLYDTFGSHGVHDDYWDELRAAGAEVHLFRPLKWHDAYKWQNRSHMRTVVIDGEVGYTGGFAIHDFWQGDGRHPDRWRDTSVRIEGPSVHQLQAAFAGDWAEATGQLLIGDRLFPSEPLDHAGPHQAGLIYGTPSLGSTDIERFYALTIAGARQRLWITNAYFVPDDDFRRLLLQATAAGVDVRVLIPGGNTDKKSTWYAARAYFEELLDGGVRIWEYDPTMVHAKTLTVDGVWCAVGSANFDNRSMSLNDEVVLMIHAPDIAQCLENRFLEDLELATEVELDRFRTRGPWERAKENFWLLFSRFL
ncbi:MAG: phospholipase D-like domain-containing protein [Gemmatimonadota bacterium]